MPDLYSISLLALHIVSVERMPNFLKIFVLEFLKFRLLFKESTEKAVVFIDHDLTLHLPERNDKSNHIITIYMH